MYEIKKLNIVLPALNISLLVEDIRHDSGELSTAGFRPGVSSSFSWISNINLTLTQHVGHLMYKNKKHNVVLPALNITFLAEDIRHDSGELSTAGLRPGVRSSFSWGMAVVFL